MLEKLLSDDECRCGKVQSIYTEVETIADLFGEVKVYYFGAGAVA
jgi:hypothetical protein